MLPHPEYKQLVLRHTQLAPSHLPTLKQRIGNTKHKTFILQTVAHISTQHDIQNA